MTGIRLIKKIFDNFEIEGFEWNSPFLIFNGTACLNIDDLKRKDIYICNKWAIPLFLTRVIEGINKDFLKTESMYYYIHIDTHIMIMDRMGIPRHDFKAKKVTDKNKEQAIKYIFNQLKKATP
jgi:hypothetical protein